MGDGSFTLRSLGRDKGRSQPGREVAFFGASEGTKDQKAGLGKYFSTTAVSRGPWLPSPPTSRRRQLLTSYLPWVLETRCCISQWGVGTGRQWVRVSLTPYMFLLLGWQSLWGEVSDLPWQDAGNRKPGRSAGWCSHPLCAVSPGAGCSKYLKLPAPAPSLSLKLNLPSGTGRGK